MCLRLLHFMLPHTVYRERREPRAHDKTGGGRACNFHSILYVRAEYLLPIDTSGRERVRYLEILSHESLECECVRH